VILFLAQPLCPLSSFQFPPLARIGVRVATGHAFILPNRSDTLKFALMHPRRREGGEALESRSDSIEDGLRERMSLPQTLDHLLQPSGMSASPPEHWVNVEYWTLFQQLNGIRALPRGREVRRSFLGELPRQIPFNCSKSVMGSEVCGNFPHFTHLKDTNCNYLSIFTSERPESDPMSLV
jgi:hypothetical protein